MLIVFTVDHMVLRTVLRVAVVRLCDTSRSTSYLDSHSTHTVIHAMLYEIVANYLFRG